MVSLTWGGKFAEIHQDVLLMKHWKLSIGTFSSLGTCLHKVYQSIHIVISSMSSLTMPITKTQNSDWYTKVITMMTSSNGNMFSVAGPLSENSPITGEFPPQWPVRQSLDVFFICVWIKSWVNNHEAGDLRRHRAHYYVIVMANLDMGCNHQFNILWYKPF